MQSKLVFKDGSEYIGQSFGSPKSAAGEVVFATGMVGYPESLTDPSFRGQILVYTYPLIGNYGVPLPEFWESGKIQVAGLVVCNYNSTPSHYSSQRALGDWLKKAGVPALEIKDTRGLTIKLREQGVMLGKMVIGKDDAAFSDPNERNLVAEVSCKKPYVIGKGKTTVVLIDCGAKANIARSLASRGLKVVVIPWNTNPLKLKQKIRGVVISNGPGNPEMADITIANIKQIIAKKIPILGICLGNQILALAGGGSAYKLKFGHRGQNQPCVLSGTRRCLLTTQNHGFAVKKIPAGFKEWFYNANDNTNEGIIHRSLPFMSVQFHPESSPGPLDADWIFDYFLKKAKII
jgi:carbamoyl-phosphate synthase small subunit